MQPFEIGDVTSQEENFLYERFAETVLAYLCQQVSQRQDAEDLLLEVFLAALQNPLLARLPAARQLAWLRRVARNKVIDHYRHIAILRLQPLAMAQELADRGVTPEQQAEDQEQRTWLLQAIEHLPPAQRELLRLRYVQELRLTQIAILMEKSEGTVRKMFSRTLQHLRKMYEQQERREKYGR